MSVDRDEASALLSDVADVEGRVRETLINASAGRYLFLWGAIFAFGFTCTYFLRAYSGPLWLGLEALGLAGTVAIAAAHRRRAQIASTAMLWRPAIALIAVVGFGTLWIRLAGMRWQLEVTFWPTLLSFILFLVSLWVGRTLTLASAAIFAVALTGYFVAGPYLHLWMAVATGGSMIAGGFWLRR
jgi:hypothetical protein